MLASSGLMNPQIRFGEDLMSRVSYVMMNPGGEVEMTRAVRQAIGVLIDQVAAEARIDPREILELTFVGNPIMHHLLLGIDPTELGGAPFALATDEAMTLWATELDLLGVHPNARVYVLPCIAGHVGADTAGVILSETPHLSDEMMLVVDIGTNAEIVLGNRERLLAASSPTGPAFEGAQIACGQRAAPGAIERVRIDRATLEPRFKVIGSDLWSEAGLRRRDQADRRHRHLRLGHHRGGGRDVPGRHPQERRHDRRRHGRAERPHPARGPHLLLSAACRRAEIRIVQNDVRAIQLAKAALYAGARLLMDHLGIERVDRITLAGAFGSHIDVKYAMVLGLIPDCDLAKVSSAGNAAGTGARIALLNRRGARRDRAGGAAHREDRDRGRAALPGALRRRDGDPARERPLPQPGERRGPAEPPEREAPRDAVGRRRRRAPERSSDRPADAFGPRRACR